MTDTTQSAPAANWHEVAPARIPEDVHVVSHGETLPSIAERHGHSGDWKAIYNLNVPEQSRDLISPDALPVGVWLRLPAEWFDKRTADERSDAERAGDAGSEPGPVQPPAPSSFGASGRVTSAGPSTAPAPGTLDTTYDPSSGPS